MPDRIGDSIVILLKPKNSWASKGLLLNLQYDPQSRSIATPLFISPSYSDVYLEMTDEEKSTELIARMLMQDQLQEGYENPYMDGFRGEDEDDDYVPMKVVQNAKRRSMSFLAYVDQL
jgi:hypothetical protein